MNPYQSCKWSYGAFIGRRAITPGSCPMYFRGHLVGATMGYPCHEPFITWGSPPVCRQHHWTGRLHFCHSSLGSPDGLTVLDGLFFCTLDLDGFQVLKKPTDSRDPCLHPKREKLPRTNIRSWGVLDVTCSRGETNHIYNYTTVYDVYGYRL